MTRFERWFKAQFKRLPLRAEEHNKLYAERQILAGRLSDIDNALRQDADMDLTWKAALYAYQFARKSATTKRGG